MSYFNINCPASISESDRILEDYLLLHLLKKYGLLKCLCTWCLAKPETTWKTTQVHLPEMDKPQPTVNFPSSGPFGRKNHTVIDDCEFLRNCLKAPLPGGNHSLRLFAFQWTQIYVSINVLLNRAVTQQEHNSGGLYENAHVPKAGGVIVSSLQELSQ